MSTPCRLACQHVLSTRSFLLSLPHSRFVSLYLLAARLLVDSSGVLPTRQIRSLQHCGGRRDWRWLFQVGLCYVLVLLGEEKGQMRPSEILLLSGHFRGTARALESFKTSRHRPAIAKAMSAAIGGMSLLSLQAALMRNILGNASAPQVLRYGASSVALKAASARPPFLGWHWKEAWNPGAALRFHPPACRHRFYVCV